ncbi:hypothetical protein T265_04222 [Opisthorchis viverrini]|uniref:Uncharacterized protein n=1 Tax=Opisthorchis viverrini TaxID=6198 RepID=A0A074ZNR2_OPIVI|nr:hypothetical protein T265_04222 [Opisthorchis viverrini]KER29033.1 hypothetical protein T265_04222 [Opisthorchis viverrini]
MAFQKTVVCAASEAGMVPRFEVCKALQFYYCTYGTAFVDKPPFERIGFRGFARNSTWFNRLLESIYAHKKDFQDQNAYIHWEDFYPLRAFGACHNLPTTVVHVSPRTQFKALFNAVLCESLRWQACFPLFISQRQPLNDKSETDPGILSESLDPVY